MSQHIRQHNILDELTLLDSRGKEQTRISRIKVFGPSELVDRADRMNSSFPKKRRNLLRPVTFEEATYAPYMTLSMLLWMSGAGR